MNGLQRNQMLISRSKQRNQWKKLFESQKSDISVKMYVNTVAMHCLFLILIEREISNIRWNNTASGLAQHVLKVKNMTNNSLAKDGSFLSIYFQK